MTREEENAALRAENAAWRAENAARKNELRTLRQQVDQLATALQAAQTRVREVEAKKTVPPAFTKANGAKKPRQARKKRPPEQNHARRLETPTHLVEQPLEHSPACQGRLSGGHLARRRQVVDLPPPPPVEVSEQQVFNGWGAFCPACREAPLDLAGQVLGQGRIGVGIASLVAHRRQVGRAPLRVIQAWLARVQGRRLSVGEISQVLRRVAAPAEGASQALRQHMRARPVVHADDPGGRANGQNGYIWLAGTPTGQRYFAYHPRRARTVIDTLLGEPFSGVLTSDGSAAYHDTPGGTHPRCRAHVLRHLHALQAAPAASLEVLVWAKAVKDVSLLAKGGLAQGRAPEQTYRDLVLRIRALGEQFAEIKGHPCQALAKRLLRHQDEVFVFVRQPGVPADNTLVQRSLRPLVSARKISGGARSAQGSQTRMTLTTLFQTWQARGLHPLHEGRRMVQSPFPQL